MKTIQFISKEELDLAGALEIPQKTKTGNYTQMAHFLLGSGLNTFRS